MALVIFEKLDFGMPRLLNNDHFDLRKYFLRV